MDIAKLLTLVCAADVLELNGEWNRNMLRYKCRFWIYDPSRYELNRTFIGTLLKTADRSIHEKRRFRFSQVPYAYVFTRLSDKR